MKRTIRNEQEFQDFATEVRNRQYENNPVKVNIGAIIDKLSYDWDKEYIEITRIGDTDFMRLLPIEFELDFCDKCFQMTNHLNGVCQKCKK